MAPPDAQREDDVFTRQVRQGPCRIVPGLKFQVGSAVVVMQLIKPGHPHPQITQAVIAKITTSAAVATMPPIRPSDIGFFMPAPDGA